MLNALQCPKCQAPLAFDATPPESGFCSGCQAPLQISIFPAFSRTIAPLPAAEAVMVEGESSCFYHPQKKAVLPCDGCGRFLCALCDCPLEGSHYCPTCLETGQKKGKIKSLENQRTVYGDVALSLALYPLLIPYLTIMAAPAAVFVSVRYWKSPRSLVRPSASRHIVALIIALLEISGWLILFLVIFSHRHSRG